MEDKRFLGGELISAILKYAKEKVGFKIVNLITNGTIFNEKQLMKLLNPSSCVKRLGK